MIGGVTSPKGFQAAGIHCGIKKEKLLDLALVVSEREGPVAGVFTNNRVVAAPVTLDRVHLKQGIGRALIVNSGNANACTGAEGLNAAEEMATLVARRLDTDLRKVFVGSTGVIGQHLPITRIRAGISAIMQRLRRAGGTEAARAILTTDLRVKQVAVRGMVGGRPVTIGGMAKGSGMIHPNMATMLAYLTTDAAISQSALQQALSAAVDQSFNCISVDGDTSTNDTVLCLSNGLAGNAPIREGSEVFSTFQKMLLQACLALALRICRDGEGVTKLAKIHVTGADTTAAAKQVANTVATSNLVKTALFGEDANWGRVMAAVGRSGVPIDQSRISLSFDKVAMVKDGVGLGAKAERRIATVFHKKEFTIHIDLGQGSGHSQVWTTDLSYDYVKINASYRS
jgi:glutamate N-acetyltransferase/amino-acid N-acetyltransferase